MLEKYSNFIINVLKFNEEFDTNSSICSFDELKKIDDGLYRSDITIDNSHYLAIISIYEEDISINSIVSRNYISDSFEGYIKEEYTTIRVDRYVRYDTGIYHEFKTIKDALVTSEFSSSKQMHKENYGNSFYSLEKDFNNTIRRQVVKIKK